MRLQPNQDFGAYHIIDCLGEGATGEVFSARDTKLKRSVAIKVLTVGAADSEALDRLDRGAKLQASLNHENICRIYSVESIDDTTAIVMELVEGVTLEQEIRSRRLTHDRALRFAVQIAAGLEHAHDHGIVHRDLKPANIKVDLTGRIKILDFGIAKMLRNDVAAASGETMFRTTAGQLLGTIPYMSPEQARGSETDQCADVWAFGCIVFELYTGQRAFQGETGSDTIAAILHSDPPIDSAMSAADLDVRSLLRHCFVKDPGSRLRDIRHARAVLEDALAPQRSDVSWRAAATRQHFWRLGLLASVIIALLVVSALTPLAEFALMIATKLVLAATVAWISVECYSLIRDFGPDPRAMADAADRRLFRKLLPEGAFMVWLGVFIGKNLGLWKF